MGVGGWGGGGGHIQTLLTQLPLSGHSTSFPLSWTNLFQSRVKSVSCHEPSILLYMLLSRTVNPTVHVIVTNRQSYCTCYCHEPSILLYMLLSRTVNPTVHVTVTNRQSYCTCYCHEPSILLYMLLSRTVNPTVLYMLLSRTVNPAVCVTDEFCFSLII